MIRWARGDGSDTSIYGGHKTRPQIIPSRPNDSFALQREEKDKEGSARHGPYYREGVALKKKNAES